ncbi:hypothetical protein [Fusobacterium varium]|uniref:PP2C family protein-serine/threonine phosphatase n=1 Tax=Fusobacterium varium TaxID=856 RepID=UPI003566E97C
MNREKIKEENEEKKAMQLNLSGRKYQSIFVTSFLSDRGDKSVNNDYLTYIELEEYGCWIIVDGNNGGVFEHKIAPFIGEMLIETFIENPTIDRKKIERMLLHVHRRYREMQISNSDMTDEYSSCSIAMAVTDYSKVTFANVGNARFMILRDNYIIKKSKDSTLAFLMYEAEKILYDEIRFRKDRNIFTHKFGIDKNIAVNVSKTMTLLPNDKILLLTQGAWENLDEDDIEKDTAKSQRVGQWIGNLVKSMNKNCYMNLSNHTLCGIFISRPAPLLPEPETWLSSARKNFSTVDKKLYKIGAVILLLLLILFGGKKFIQYRKLEKMYNFAIEKEKVGDTMMAERKYRAAFEDYQTGIENYMELSKYRGNRYEERIKDLEYFSNQAKISEKIAQSVNTADIMLKNQEFQKAVDELKSANVLALELREDNSLKDEVKHKLATAEILNSAFEEKLKADELYLQKANTNRKRQQMKKEAMEIYERIAPIFLENTQKAIYDEIIEKVEAEKSPVPKKTSVKVTTAESLLKEGNKMFEQFRYYKSYELYTSALKKSKDSKMTEMIKGKINMNGILLRGVQSELDGDRLIRDKNNKEIAENKYKEAMNQYKKLRYNEYMPSQRYNVIIERLEKKIKK